MALLDHGRHSPSVQDLVMNQALNVRCSSTSEIVWARLHGFPWWPAIVVKPDGAGFQVGLRNLLDNETAFGIFGCKATYFF